MSQARDNFRRILPLLSAAALLPMLVGCGFGGVPVTGSTPLASTSNNWELTTKATTNGNSTQPLTDLSGSILEETGSGASHRTTAVFQATAGCYADSEVVPLDGSINGAIFQARSFGVRGQFLTINGNFDATAANMTGTYQIGGGCSNGEAGTFTGVRYRALTGTYAGTATSGGVAHAISLVVTQSTDPTGQGSFILSGTGSFGGFSCFTTGTVPVQGGTISGSKMLLTLNADGTSGAVINLVGTIDPDAAAMTLSTAQVLGSSSCAGDLGTVTLKRQ